MSHYVNNHNWYQNYCQWQKKFSEKEKKNRKGQIVIPKKIRDALHIGEHTPINIIARDDAIHLYPVTSVTTTEEDKLSTEKFLALLKATRGAWADEDWQEYDKLEREKHKLELTESKKRKKAW